MHDSLRSTTNTSGVLGYPPVTGNTFSAYNYSTTIGKVKLFMNKDKTPKRLEGYEPGASKEQVFDALRKVAEAKKKPTKTDDLPPGPASS